MTTSISSSDQDGMSHPESGIVDKPKMEKDEQDFGTVSLLDQLCARTPNERVNDALVALRPSSVSE